MTDVLNNADAPKFLCSECHTRVYLKGDMMSYCGNCKDWKPISKRLPVIEDNRKKTGKEVRMIRLYGGRSFWDEYEVNNEGWKLVDGV